MPVKETPIFAYKQKQNLKDILVHSACKPKPKLRDITLLGEEVQVKGNFPCGHCNVCINCHRGKSFVNPVDNVYRGFFNCNTKGVIYAIICPCKKIYVGMTERAIKIRISEHKSCIRNQRAQASSTCLEMQTQP